MSDKQLRAQSARWRAAARTRFGNRRIRDLRAHLAPLVEGRPVNMLGSAPHGPLPVTGDRPLICANGSAAIAARRGLVPDVTIIGGYTTSPRRAEVRASLERLRGVHSRSVVFIEHGDTVPGAQSTLASITFSYDHFITIDALDRAAIIGGMLSRNYGLGPRDERISMGVFGIVLSLWAGASSVTAHRISLGIGHAFGDERTPRSHLEGDGSCLAELVRGGRVTLLPRSLTESLRATGDPSKRSGA